MQKTMMNHYLSQYIDKVSFDFVYETALPIGWLAVATGVVTTAVRIMIRPNNVNIYNKFS